MAKFIRVTERVTARVNNKINVSSKPYLLNLDTAISFCHQPEGSSVLTVDGALVYLDESIQEIENKITSTCQTAIV